MDGPTDQRSLLERRYFTPKKLKNSEIRLFLFSWKWDLICLLSGKLWIILFIKTDDNSQVAWAAKRSQDS
jgi:hypothetical protein